MSVMLKKGDKAPNFKVQDQDGNIIELKSLRGKKVVLFFYPADNTPTCTVEACNLRDHYADLQGAGYEVYGISPDPVQSHKKFIAKQNLPYRLLSDPDLKVAKAYGVWAEKQMFGRKYMGILRTTFIIDPKGKIDQVFTKVISKDHAAQILGG